MKKLSMLLAVLSIGTSPILADEDTIFPSVKQELYIGNFLGEEKHLGKLAIQDIRRSYEGGEFDPFLRSLEKKYKKAVESGEVDSLGAMRPGVTEELIKWEAKGKELEKAKNHDLLSLLRNEEDFQNNSLLFMKLESAASEVSSTIQQKAIDEMTKYRQMPLNSGRSSDENILIALDVEYEYKALQIDLPNASVEEKRAKQSALKMEKITCMKELSKQFTDQKLKELVAVYVDQFDARLAQSWDIADLNALANGRVKPSNAVEEKIALILTIYQDQFSDLTKDYMQEKR